MKIILLKDVPGLGRSLEIKRVKPGYGRNFLLPQNLAMLATRKSLRWREKQLKNQETLKKRIEKEIATTIEKLKKITIKIPVKTGKKGELFEKIDGSKIEKFLKKEGIHNIKQENIKILEEIKKIGEYFVEIGVGDNILKVKLNLVKEKKNKKK